MVLSHLCVAGVGQPVHNLSVVEWERLVHPGGGAELRTGVPLGRRDRIGHLSRSDRKRAKVSGFFRHLIRHGSRGPVQAFSGLLWERLVQTTGGPEHTRGVRYALHRNRKRL